MGKKAEKIKQFNELSLDGIENKFDFINKVSKKVLSEFRETKEPREIDVYLKVLSENVPDDNNEK